MTGKFSDNLEFADSAKKKSFVDSIVSGNFHNQAAKGAESALSCMLARTAAYTGQEVTWDAFAEIQGSLGSQNRYQQAALVRSNAANHSALITMERAKQIKVDRLQTNLFEEHFMSRTSRRDFLKSSANDRLHLGTRRHGTSWFTGSIRRCRSASCARHTSSARSAPLALKKGVLLDMLPEKMSFAERFMLAKNVGFDVVQAPTTPNQQTAEEIRARGRQGRYSTSIPS